MKKAFTMLELIFVIVVIGILAAVIIPNTKTNPVAEAAVNLLSQIRYTQHLALIDDKFDPNNASWYKNRWQIVLNGNTYSIVSNNNTKFAKNPQNNSALNNILLQGITAIATTGGCANQSIISFDHLGRPLVGNLAGLTTAYTATGNSVLLTSDCNLTLTYGNENVIITIRPETGYASIED